MRGITRLQRRASFLAFGLIIALLAGLPALAGISIANAPLFVSPPVIPSLILAVDDSGSMDSEILARSNDGAMWWHMGDRSFTGRNQQDQIQPGVVNFNLQGDPNATWKKFVYLFPNNTGQTSGRRGYGDSTHDHYAVPPLGAFAYSRSPKYNYSYFNPTTVYTPWPNLGGYTFTNSNPASAKTDPTRGTETFNLTVAREQTGTNHVFKMYPGMTIPAGTRYRDWTSNSWTTAAQDIDIDQERLVPISYFPATFYLSTSTVFGGLGYNPSNHPDGVAPDGSLLYRFEIKPENFETLDAYNAAIQNFANWFTYYRKRHIATRGAIGAAFENIRGMRIGSYLINSLPNPTTNLVMRDMSVATDRTAFFQDVYHNFLGTGGTPNRQAVNHMRNQFARTDANAPIREACQMNFGVLFTDGYANNWTGANVGNRDGNKGPPFADTASNTMADIAMALYEGNPRPDLGTGLVPVPIGCNATNPSPRLDCNRNLHVNLFALTLGTPGTIFKVNEDATRDPFTHHPVWPTAFSDRNPVHVDDLWHATLNSRGLLLDVEVPADLGSRFAEILADIAARLESSTTSAAASSAILETDTLLYTTGFRSSDWSGNVQACWIRQYDEEGNLVGTLECEHALAWDAETELRKLGAANRKIFTLNSATSDGVALDFNNFENLSEAQQAALNYRVGTSHDDEPDNLGAARVSWLRGVEGAHTSFRSRSGTGEARLLGDIVHSNPQLKHGVLYVGANDGMLHAFDGATGRELFAYVPGYLLLPESKDRPHSPLNRLMEPEYAHRYFVDGTVAVTDVRIGDTDRTILVGSLGAGGRAIYALDVSSPAHFKAEDVLWEFTDPDLGYSLGQPSIVKMSNNTWAVVFANGYNSDDHRAVLFVVNLETGALIKKIDTGVGTIEAPNGLAAPVVTDWPAMDLRAGRIYAGDLLGNLWRFDVAGAPDQWDATGNRKVLFQAEDPSEVAQPITAKPALAVNPRNRDEILVLFGTGSYFRLDDGYNDQIQSLYGILDIKTQAQSTLTRDELLEQEILSQGVESFGSYDYEVRLLSNYEIDSSQHRGWFIDLNQETGERVISEATPPSGPVQRRVRFTTLIPDEDICNSSRRGFLMDIDLVSGGRVDYSIFDLDRDGNFDDDDMVNDQPVSGVGFGGGERPTTIRVNDSLQELIYTGDPDQDNLIGRGEEGMGGRQSWQQLR